MWCVVWSGRFQICEAWPFFFQLPVGLLLHTLFVLCIHAFTPDAPDSFTSPVTFFSRVPITIIHCLQHQKRVGIFCMV